MPKGKLVLPASTDVKKLEVAAYLSNVKMGDGVKIADEIHTEISYPTIDNLVKLGRFIETVKGTELDAKKAKDAEKAAKSGKGK